MNAFTILGIKMLSAGKKDLPLTLSFLWCLWKNALDVSTNI